MKKRRTLLLIGLPLGALLLAPFVVPLFFPWSEINCRHEYINIKTGQARYARYFWFIKVSDRVTDTPLSLALDGETVDVADIKAWHCVNTLSPGLGHSPHYAFHGAFYYINRLETIESAITLTPQRKREVARSILTDWQLAGSDSGTKEYITALYEEACSKDGGRPASLPTSRPQP